MKTKFLKSNYDFGVKKSSLIKNNDGNVLKAERYAASNTIFTQPHFYSPLHTPQNWQIPSKRKEVYLWARYFFENEPKIAAAIQFYSEFPMQGFELQCADSKVKKHFDRLNKRLNFEYWLPLISSEYFMLGDAFPFVQISCHSCGGSGQKENGESCEHKGGTFSKLIVLNPDWIEVKQNVLADEPVVQLIPDDDLKKIIAEKYPQELYDRIPMHIRNQILSGMPIRLSNKSVTHLKHTPSPYRVYGLSLIKRLFKILAYKDRLMTANWMVAERLILPIRIVKIGNDDRPAGAADIANVQQQLANVQNDPNLTLVTHHAFDYCHDPETEVLTENGWKFYDEVLDNEKIMVFNPNSEEAYLDNYKDRHKFPKKERDMYHFSGKKVDVMVTEKHRMLTRDKFTKEWHVKTADKIKFGDKLRSVANWKSNSNIIETIDIPKIGHIPVNDFLYYLGRYLSEGHSTFNENSMQYTVSVSQKKYGGNIEEIRNFVIKLGIKYHEYCKRGDDPTVSFDILNRDFTKWMIENFGSGCQNKQIPSWILNLPKESIQILLNSLTMGDETVIKKHSGYDRDHSVYTTLSKKLSGDIQEIIFKLGYSSTVSQGESKGLPIYNIRWSKIGNRGNFPEIRKSHIKKEKRNCYVWCFETETGFFVTRRNGKVTIQGNSFVGAQGQIVQLQNEHEMIGKEILDGLMLPQAVLNSEMAGYQGVQIGAEILITRLRSWTDRLSKYIEDKIYLPEAKMQGFIDEEESRISGETVYLYPTIVWNDLGIRDDSQKKQQFVGLHDAGIISTQTLCEMFGLDYDQEIERRREEASIQMSLGGMNPMMGGMGGPMGGGGMGPPPMGGGMGGPMGDMGMGDMGMAPDMGGDMGGMGGDMGGGMGAAPASSGSARGTSGKIMKRKNRRKVESDQKHGHAIMPEQIQLTSIERILWNRLFNDAAVRIPFKKYAQFKIRNPSGQPYIADFAIPELKILIEADGPFHRMADKIEKDAERDRTLANRGWITLRFKDYEIEDQIDRVVQTIMGWIDKRSAALKNFVKNKKSSVIENIENNLKQLHGFQLDELQ